MSTPLPDHETNPDAWSAAHALARNGHIVHLNGIVSHASVGSITALTCLFGSAACIAGILWPVTSTVLLFIILLSALADLDGGSGWVRRFVAKGFSHNMMVWPNHQEQDDPNRPTLLIVAPLSCSETPRTESLHLLIAPIILCLLGSITIAGQHAWGSNPPIGVSCALLLISVCTWAIDKMSRRSPSPNPARAVWEHELNRKRDSASIRVVWALVDHTSGHYGAMQTLLLNHAHRLSKQHTRILCLHTSTDPMSIVQREGWIRPKQSDPLITAMATDLKLRTVQGFSASRTALRLGWRAASIWVASDQSHLAQQAVDTIVTRSHQCAQGGQW